MPPSLQDERRPAITPQLALRVAVLGGVAFALFAIVFFRLWFLQVLSGEEYVSQARANKARNIKIEAPRGNIVDRNGAVLVKTKEAAVVQIEADEVPEVEQEIAERYQKAASAAERERLRAEAQATRLARRGKRSGERTTKADRREIARLRRAGEQAPPVDVPALPAGAVEARRLYRRLAAVINVKPSTIHERVVKSIAQQPYADVTVRTGVPRAAYNYLLERQAEFPGVRPTRTFLRHYPFKENGAHLFGTLAEISPEQQELKRYRDVEAGTRIGTSGLEERYDRWLRGTDGYTRVSVDAQGRPRDEIAAVRREPRQGNQLKLSLDIDLERAADDAMQRAIAATGFGDAAGGYVAMNPETGEIYAMGSYPSFDANVFAKPISESRYAALNSKANGAPLFNRALSAGYPTGSTFKPISAVAALDSGAITPGGSYFDSGKFCLGSQCRQNARGAQYGSVAMSQAMKVSVDTYFYELGRRMNDLKGRPLQTWARRLGLGRRTGIDLPQEPPGLVPDAAWRNREFRAYERCRAKRKLNSGSVAALLACGGIERPWTVGDNVSLAIGQGDLQATPLQMAVAYAAIANGGRVVRPQLGREIQDGAQVPIQDLERGARRRVDIDPDDRAVILDGLRRAASEDGGTSTAVMKGLGAVYGKTGTVQRDGQQDQSWYAAYVNQQKRPIVVVTTIEKGGFGSETAAPAACRIIAKWYGKRVPCTPGAVE